MSCFHSEEKNFLFCEVYNNQTVFNGNEIQIELLD